MAKHTHLTLDDRYTISNLLNSSTSFKAIALEIEKDCTTVSKEVRNHCVFKKLGHQVDLLIVAYIAKIVFIENFV